MELILPKIVLFDADGTLFDNSKVVVEAYYTALQKYELPMKSKEFIASLMGKSTYETARSMDVPEDTLDKVDQYFWDYFGEYATRLESRPNIFPGTERVLKLLKSNEIRMGICTSNEAKSIELLVNKGSLSHFFDTIVGSEHTINKKPSADPLMYALKKLNFTEFERPDIWFVGDTEFDVMAAKELGVVSVGIPMDHTRKNLIASEPDLISDSMEAFYKLLQTLT